MESARYVDSHRGAKPEAEFMADGNVLIVEDEPASRLLAKKLVASLGYTVATANDGQDALTALRQHPGIKVVLTDCYMPNLDGFDLAQAMRDDPTLAHIPCILLSADEKLREKAKESQFFAWIKKPIRAENVKPVLTHPALKLESNKAPAPIAEGGVPTEKF